MPEAGPRRRPTGGRTAWLVFPVAVLLLVGASSPWIAQTLPRALFPALAAIGALLLVVAFIRSLVRFARCRARRSAYWSGEKGVGRQILLTTRSTRGPLASLACLAACHSGSAMKAAHARWRWARSS